MSAPFLLTLPPYPCPIVSGLFSKDYLWWNFSALRSDPIPRTRILWMPPNGNTTSKNYILRTLVNDEISNSNFIALLLVLFVFFLSWMLSGGFELFRIFSFSLYTKFCFFSSENNADWCTFWTIIHSSILFSLTTYCMKFESFLFTLSFSKNMYGKKLF